MILTSLAIVAAVCLLVCLAIGWILTLVGLPGNWVIVAAAALYAWIIPHTWRLDVGWRWVIAVALLAAIGELLESLAGAFGTQRAGGSRRAALGALIGSMIGGISGAFVALPVPLVGPLVGAILFGGVGAALGAVVAELSGGSEVATSWRVGRAGRLATRPPQIAHRWQSKPTDVLSRGDPWHCFAIGGRSVL